MILPVCSVATQNCLKEFLLLKFSFEQYHQAHWYVSTDSYSAEKLKSFSNVTVLNLVKTDDCSHGVDDPVKNRLFLELIMTKFDALEKAIEHHGYGLFLDSDMFFTNPLEERFIELMQNHSIDAILSPHMTNNLGLETQVGHFNVGFFAMRNLKYLNAHRDMSWKHKEFGMYYEQQPLQFTSYPFLTVNAPIYYNIGWWRFNEKHSQYRVSLLNTDNNVINFEDKPAVCFHAHVLKDLDYQNFGSFLVQHIFNMMGNCDNKKYKEFLTKYNELKND